MDTVNIPYYESQWQATEARKLSDGVDSTLTAVSSALTIPSCAWAVTMNSVSARGSILPIMFYVQSLQYLVGCSLSRKKNELEQKGT